MAEVFVVGMTYVRMLLHEARAVPFEDEQRGCVLTVERNTPCQTMCACLEDVSVHEVVCDESDPARLTFTYVF